MKKHVFKHTIRYYPSFPMVIPVLRVSYLYITHPFATGVQVHPFDLHVLGMPPALILSQDQTLNKSLSYSTCFYLVFKDLVILLYLPQR